MLKYKLHNAIIDLLLLLILIIIITNIQNIS